MTKFVIKAAARFAAFCVLALPPSACTQAALLDDFESASVGLLDGQSGWTASTNVRVARDFHADNLLMQIAGGYASAFKPLDALSIADDDVGTLFFRFQVDGDAVDYTLGLADVVDPASWGDYEATTRVYPDQPATVKAQGRNGDVYEDLPLNGGANNLAPGTWHHLWMVANNAADTVDYYLEGGLVGGQRLVAQDYGFRNGTSDPLTAFLMVAGWGASSNIFVDDIYVWQGQNLASPIGRPSSVSVDVTPTPGPPIGLDPPRLFDFAAQRLEQTQLAMPANRMPERTYGGYWNQTSAGAWTSGFFAGQLWMTYRQTDDPGFLLAAKARTAALEGQEYNGGDHDIGFRVFNSFGQGYMSLPAGDPDRADYLDRILIAADTLADRYRPAYEAIESWGGNNVIIDNMMNLELLFWSAEQTSDAVDAQTWREIAISHALTTQREHVRPDGSTYHVVQFDPVTGEVVDKRTAQGYADESTWSRGQAWGLYGFTMTYRFTSDLTFLETATAMADYWLDRLPAEGVVPYDFDDPGPDVPLDSSAAAIASAALLELMDYVDPVDAPRYFDAARTMLEGLSSPEILTNGLPYESILQEGSIAKGVHHMGLVYGDYYFIEALQRYEEYLNGRGDFNADGVVDGRDFLLWQRGESPAPVSADDLNNWMSRFGEAPTITAWQLPVPEPESLLLVLLSAGLFHSRGKRAC